MKRLLALFFVLLLLLSVFVIGAVPASAIDGINYDDWVIYDSEIIKYVGNDANVVVPSVDEEGYPLITIGNAAFSDAAAFLESVVVSEGIKNLATSAFEYCDKLKEVSLPFSLQTMEMSCFRRCKILESIVIPPNVECIGTTAFSGCYRLSEIIISDGVKKIASRAFGSTAANEIIIPESVEEIEGSAFYYLTAEVGEHFDLYIVNDNINLGKIDTTVYDKYDSIAPIVELAGHNSTTTVRVFGAKNSETEVYMADYMPETEFVPTEKSVLETKNEWCKEKGVQPPKEERVSKKSKRPLFIALTAVMVLAVIRLVILIISKKKNKKEA